MYDININYIGYNNNSINFNNNDSVVECKTITDLKTRFEVHDKIDRMININIKRIETMIHHINLIHEANKSDWNEKDLSMIFFNKKIYCFDYFVFRGGYYYLNARCQACKSAR